MFRLVAAASAAVLCLSASASGQYLMMPDSTNNRMVLFDPFDGSVVNSNYFPLAGGTPIHAIQVGNEIWLSEQIGDRVSRWDLVGNPLGSISGGLDNVRGMGLVQNKVYVTNAGTNNGAPGNAVVIYDTLGNLSDTFSTVGLAPSPFGILEHQGGILVSSSSANDDIHRFGLDGTPLGTFHNSTSLNFAEQMVYAANGDVLVAGFSTNNIARLNANDGSLITSFNAAGARGVWQLGNGNIMWTSGAGASIFDVNSGTNSLVYSGGGRYIDFVEIPTPGVTSIMGLAGFVAVRRRR